MSPESNKQFQITDYSKPISDSIGFYVPPPLPILP